MLAASAAAVTTSAVSALQAVPTLKETSLAVYALVQTLYSSRDSEVSGRLKCMDLDARAKVIEALVSDLDSVESKCCSSVVVAREFLRETMAELRVALEHLRTCSEIYNEAYFASFRYGSDVECAMDSVTTLGRMLRKRTEMLVQVLPLIKYD